MSDPLVISNGVLVTMNDAGDVLHGGTVVIEGDRITQVLPAGAAVPAGRVLDAEGKAVLPGLVDLHYHTALGKGYSDHLPLLEYLETCWYPLIRALDPEAAYWAALASYSESLRCGVTTVNDMYRELDSLGRAAREIGIRAVLSNDVAIAEHRLDTLADNESAFRRWHGEAGGRIEVRVGIEWLPLASPELLRDARGLADDLGTGIHIHLNESLGEVETVLARHGRRPTELAADTGILGPDCVAAHCVWLSDAEIAMMRETGTQIAHNPTSNAKLGNGIARVPEMLAAGLNVGLGHDAAECNNSRDLFEVMKFGSLVHRANRTDAGLFQAPDMLGMATRNGARALGHETGELTPGRKADVILLDLHHQAFTPLEPGNADHLYSHLVFAASGANVTHTIVDGVVLLADRVFTTIDEAEVLAKANESFLRVLERVRR
ncbi:amidohydrolase family protein [Actinokineospora globicatena]|uniref:amidohydrolase family protein n=1 Tax=Actinokineospora globicatena TaxID=103729 RepID=UPI0020A35E5D|nr:amidohydrolase [Actinokineospora globicatena]MCP2304546.1 5-methylthioadenosine/S-adenosylhomocysteine deaminase [Actinokineospora globicatena]GLW78085.1 N-ethylammeline chlorohydrolase [Actinokineospora globicatena]GLW85249.1 N-ethylammeline chlorohydrolase [Actinokineospora globicatena]